MVTDAVSRHSSGILSLDSFEEYVSTSGEEVQEGASLLDARLDSMPRDPHGVFGGSLPSFKEVKRLLVEEAMMRAKGNRTKAAELLGTTRQALTWHLRKQDEERTPDGRE